MNKQQSKELAKCQKDAEILTDDEIAMIISNQVLSESNTYDYLKFARSVEKMILDKNK
jgi:hypothetical protein